MKLLGAILIAVGCSFAAYLFLVQEKKQQSQQKELLLSHRLNEELFDKNFQQGWMGQEIVTDDERAGRITALRAELQALRERVGKESAEEEVREAQIKSDLERLARAK